MPPIYLDNNATTPVDPDVLEAMLPFLRSSFGNPSSAYALGRHAREAIETARCEVAELIGAHADEIVFTGSATEATNLAIRGVVAARTRPTNIVTSNVEHPATEACCNLLQRTGWQVRRVAARASGVVAPLHVADAIDDETALVTIIHAQNEIGTLQPVAEIARHAERVGAAVHVDAAQSVGKIDVDVNGLAADLLTVAGHKLYAPKGVGALFVRRGVALQPILVGAAQEHGLRPGTENVALIVGMGAACKIAGRVLTSFGRSMTELAAALLARLQRDIPGLIVVGDRESRLPNTLSVLFPGVSGRQLLETCPTVMASTGSACHAGSEEPSAVLVALGLPRDRALGAVRLSLGRSTTSADVDRAASELARAWRALQNRRAASRSRRTKEAD